jgi:hypothetical protein
MHALVFLIPCKRTTVSVIYGIASFGLSIFATLPWKRKWGVPRNNPGTPHAHQRESRQEFGEGDRFLACFHNGLHTLVFNREMVSGRFNHF